MNKFIKKYSEFKMQIHEKLQIWTIKCLMLKLILRLKGNFWDIDPLNSPILWKFKIRLIEQYIYELQTKFSINCIRGTIGWGKCSINNIFDFNIMPASTTTVHDI